MKLTLPYDQANSTPIYPREIKACVQKTNSIYHMFIEIIITARHQR